VTDQLAIYRSLITYRS